MKKRILVIIGLLFFGVFLFSITKTYEKHLINYKNSAISDGYEPFKKVSGFNPANSERYIRYYEKNKNLSYDDVVTYVNIGLDYKFYNYISKTDTSKDLLMLVNKYLKLEENYVPKDLEEINSIYFINGNKNVRLLRKEAKEAFEQLSYDSIKNGNPVYGQSAYRDYNRQKDIYNSTVKESSIKVADMDTARPGHSEHQTGLAIDVSSTKNGNMLNFEFTASYNWMLNNAHKYGFILRYPRTKEDIHGFIFESWHYRYVGVAVATYMKMNYPDLTFDEYYYKFIAKKKGPVQMS